jgi:hypothetical protein
MICLCTIYSVTVTFKYSVTFEYYVTDRWIQKSIQFFNQ